MSATTGSESIAVPLKIFNVLLLRIRKETGAIVHIENQVIQAESFEAVEEQAKVIFANDPNAAYYYQYGIRTVNSEGE